HTSPCAALVLPPFPPRRSSDLGGEHLGFIGVAHDITEWKLAEDALRAVNATLARNVEDRTGDLQAALARLRDETAERERAEEARSEEHTSELQSRENLVCRLLL